MRMPASNLGLTELALDGFAAGSPATGEAAFVVLPTYSPEGRLLAPFLPTRLSFSVEAPSDLPGAPDAPRCPSGVAAKLPRRLPATGPGGVPTAGCRLSEIMPPPEREPDRKSTRLNSSH